MIMKPLAGGVHHLKVILKDEDNQQAEYDFVISFKYKIVHILKEKTIKIEEEEEDEELESMIKESPSINEEFLKLLNKFLKDKQSTQNKTKKEVKVKNTKPIQIKFLNFNRDGVLKITFN